MDQTNEIKKKTLQNFRQPIVTATGLILGFILDFAGSWLTRAFTEQPLKDLIVAVGLIGCITLLLIVLFRILRMDYPRDKVEVYYKKTLHLFVLGISIPFVIIIILVIERIINR